MRHRHSSSESSESTYSDDYKSSKKNSNKYKKRRSRSSSSSSSSSSPRRSKKHSSSRRRYRSSSSTSSRSETSSRKKYSKSKNSRSRSPKKISSKPNKFDSNDKTKSSFADESRFKENFEFKDSVNDLYKNEKLRQKQINKLENDHESGGGFKPKSFKSSRSTKTKEDTTEKSNRLKSDLEHENAIFGGSSLIKNENLTKTAELLINPNIVGSSNKSIMHENFFEDIRLKENRWRLKMMEILSKNNL